MLPGHRSDVALVERVASWSVRHRGLAVAGWLLVVLLAVLAGALAGEGASARDPGESGRAAEVLDQQRSYAPVRENEYRALAERAVQAQESSERKLDELQERMRSVERILKEVE